MTIVPFRRMQSVLLFCFMAAAGCGVHPGASTPGHDKTPLTNEAVALRVLTDAWNALAIPSVKDAALSVGVAGDSASAALVTQIARDGLAALGYRIEPEKVTSPRATVIVDTLVVAVTVRPGLFRKESVDRSAHAALIVTLDSGDSPAKVFRASGDYSDVIPASTAGWVADVHPYVLEHRAGHWFSRCAKPFGLAFFMTVFAWSLFSYHG